MGFFRVLDEKYTRPSNLIQLLSELLPLVNGIVTDPDVFIELENKYHPCKRKVRQNEHETMECKGMESGLCEIFKCLHSRVEQSKLKVKPALQTANCELSDHGYCSIQRNFVDAEKSLNVEEEGEEASLSISKEQTTPKSKIPVRVCGSAIDRKIKKNASPSTAKSCLKSGKVDRYINGVLDVFPKIQCRVTFNELVEDSDMEIFPLKGINTETGNRHLKQPFATAIPIKGKTTSKSKILTTDTYRGSAIDRNANLNVSPSTPKSCLKSRKVSRCVNGVIDGFPKIKCRVTFNEFVEDSDMEIFLLKGINKTTANRHLNQPPLTERPPWRY
ncbi:hypothetical protein Trydic_g22760 [Trypoxylus dichotomus]